MKRCTALSPQLTQRVCIWFLTKLNWDFTQTKQALTVCFGHAILSDSRIYHWMTEFRNGCACIVDLHRRQKHKSGRSVRNIRAVENAVTSDRRITIPRLMVETGLKASTVYRILKKDLALSKHCAKYVPSLLGAAQIARRVSVCDFWTHLRLADRRVLKVMVTVDESWIYMYDPETKEQSKEWLCAMEPHPQKPQRTIATGKVMVVTFFDSLGLIYREFVHQPRTVNQNVFRQILTRFDIAFQNRRPRGVARGRHYIHMDNASAHTAFLTRQHLQNLGWTIIPHLPIRQIWLRMIFGCIPM